MLTTVRNHFTATGIVFNEENKILMINHRKLKVWLPPGGHVEENELPDDALTREIFEETGVRVEIIDGRGAKISDAHCCELARPFLVLLEDIESDGTHNHIDLVYLCRALSVKLSAREKEVDGIGWFTPDEIYHLKTFNNVVKTVERAVAAIS